MELRKIFGEGIKVKETPKEIHFEMPARTNAKGLARRIIKAFGEKHNVKNPGPPHGMYVLGDKIIFRVSGQKIELDVTEKGVKGVLKEE